MFGLPLMLPPSLPESPPGDTNGLVSGGEKLLTRRCEWRGEMCSPAGLTRRLPTFRLSCFGRFDEPGRGEVRCAPPPRTFLRRRLHRTLATWTE